MLFCESTQLHSLSASMDAAVIDITKSRFRLDLLFFSSLALLGLAAIGADLFVVEAVKGGAIPRPIQKLLSLAEVFGHGYGVALILITVYCLDRTQRKKLPWLASAAFGAGMASNVGKLLIARTRPHHLAAGGNIFDSFSGWLPLLGDSGQQSFPSSHTATSVGLAVALAWRYPQGRYLFATFAGMAGLQRIVSLNHFVSDVCWGAAIGYLVARVCIAKAESNRGSMPNSQLPNHPIISSSSSDSSRAA